MFPTTRVLVSDALGLKNRVAVAEEDLLVQVDENGEVVDIQLADGEGNRSDAVV